MSSKVITGINTRWSYVHVWEPEGINGGAKKYSVSLIIPKEDAETISAIHAAIKSAYDTGKSKLQGTGKYVPELSSLKTPLKDGDLEKPHDTAYANSYYVTASSNDAPEIVDKDCNPITDHDEVYSGVYGRASINFYPYNTGGNRGIAVSLGNLQKYRDGERLGGRPRAKDDFSKIG